VAEARCPHGRSRPVSTATGEISLDIAVRSGPSTAASQYYRGQLRWFRPHGLDGSGQVCCTVINLGGGDLGGDTYELEAAVQTGARLLLTTQSTPRSIAHRINWFPRRWRSGWRRTPRWSTCWIDSSPAKAPIICRTIWCLWRIVPRWCYPKSSPWGSRRRASRSAMAGCGCALASIAAARCWTRTTCCWNQLKRHCLNPWVHWKAAVTWFLCWW